MAGQASNEESSLRAVAVLAAGAIISGIVGWMAYTTYDNSRILVGVTSDIAHLQRIVDRIENEKWK